MSTTDLTNRLWSAETAPLAPLRALVAGHPMHERFWMWLMVALSRQGRLHPVEQDAAGSYRLLDPVRAVAAELRGSARPATRRLSAVP